MSAATTTRSAFFAALLVVDATLVIVMAVAIGISSFATDTTKQLGKPPDTHLQFSYAQYAQFIIAILFGLYLTLSFTYLAINPRAKALSITSDVVCLIAFGIAGTVSTIVTTSGLEDIQKSSDWRYFAALAIRRLALVAIALDWVLGALILVLVVGLAGYMYTRHIGADAFSRSLYDLEETETRWTVCSGTAEAG